jgi:NitT/TauT family transport system permease protein
VPETASPAREQRGRAEQTADSRGWSGAALARALGTREHVIAVLAVTSFFVVWQAVAWTGSVSPLFISSPIAIYEAAARLAGTGTLLNHFQASSMTYLSGMALAILVGIPLGILVGWSRLAAAALDPFISFLLATPRVAFFPLILIWLGIGRESMIFVVFLMTVLDMAVSTASGINQMDRDLLRTARSFGATDVQVIRTVALPGAAPYILTGLRLAIGHGLIAIVVAELWVGQVGIGYLLANSGQRFRTADLFVGVLVLVVVGIVLTEVVKWFEARLQSWRPARAD